MGARVLYLWSFVLLYSQKIGGRFHSPLTPFAWGRNSCVRFARLINYRLPKLSASFVRNICLADAFLCLLLPNDIRVLFHEKALFLRFLFSLFSLYLPLFYRETSGRRPREQRHNSPPTKSAFCLTKPEKG